MNTHEACTNPLTCWFAIKTIRRPHWLVTIGALALVFLTIHQIQRPVIASRGPASKQPMILSGSMNEEISVRAAGRGNPWISLADGHDLVTAYAGEERLVDAFEQNQAKPLSLASGDFDEDGVPDLIAGYRAESGEGIIAVHRGNEDAIFPNSVEAQQRRANGEFTDAPFLSPALVYSVPAGVGFVGTGDFDGDGHCDVVATERNGGFLHLMSGDGRGVLSLSKVIPLPGGVTAMIVGEMNRRDGLDDIVVCIDGDAGAKALVFEGPEGALNATPEEIDLPQAATSLALGELDDEYWFDLAVAAGRELVVVHGRDRNLSTGVDQQPGAAPAVVEMRTFPVTIQSLAVGHFTGSADDEIALLFQEGQIEVLTDPVTREKTKQTMVKGGEAMTSPKPFNPQESAVASRAVSTYPAGDRDFRKRSYQKGVRPVGTWSEKVLTKNGESKTAQLIRARVSSAPVDNLLIADEASGEVRVVVAGQKERKALKGLKSADLNDETVEATLDVGHGTVAVLPMRLNKDALSDLVVLEAGRARPSVIQTVPQSILIVTNTNSSGTGSLRDQMTLANSMTGLDEIRFSISGSGVRTISLTSALPSITGALTIDGYTQTGSSPNTLTNGDNATLRIELNGAGAGAANGLDIRAGSSVVRGLIINRFGLAGISLTSNGANQIDGNFIGVNSTGTTKLGNQTDGISVGSADNTIGGLTPARKNLISGNVANGILLSGASCTRNNVQGNHIGTNAFGTLPLGNTKDGVLLQSAPVNTIGGTSASARNVIGGNSGIGIEVANAQQFLVRFNSIGTDSSGTTLVGNSKDGMKIYAGANGTVTDVISANNGFSGIAKGSSAVATIRPNVQIFSNVLGGLVFFPEIIFFGCVPTNRTTGINSVSTFGNTMTVSGYVFDGARPNKVVTFDLYSGFVNPAGNQFVGSLPIYLGTASRTTNSIGLATFSLDFSLPPGSNGQFVNAQATADGRTDLNSNFLQIGTGCTGYTLVPATNPATIPAAGGTGSFLIQTQAGCQWRIIYNACDAVFDVSSGTGPRTVTYTLFPRIIVGGGSQTFRFIVEGQVHTVTQASPTGGGGGGNCTTTPILINQTINGTISEADCTAPHLVEHKADVYTLNATAGQTININMVQGSSSIDPYLILTTLDGALLDVNDDIDPGRVQSSRIIFPITITGTYRIEATTFNVADRGPYSLSVTLNACVSTPISVGQTLNGAITDGDCNDPFGDGQKTDLYTFNATAGQIITATMTKLSSSIDPYLILIAPGGGVLAQDDDSAGQQNAQIVANLPSSGTYTIEATTFLPTDRGPYSLSLISGGGTTCDFALNPTFASVNAASGTGSFTVAVQSGCNWTAISNASWLTTTSTGSGNATVNYSFQQNTSGSSRTGVITVGDATHTVTQALQTIAVPDFSLSFEEPTVTGLNGTKARITVIINRTGGFAGEVTVTPPPKQAGIKAKPPDPITTTTTDPTASFKIKIAFGLEPGSRQLTFTGTDASGKVRTATATLIVQ